MVIVAAMCQPDKAWLPLASSGGGGGQSGPVTTSWEGARLPLCPGRRLSRGRGAGRAQGPAQPRTPRPPGPPCESRGDIIKRHPPVFPLTHGPGRGQVSALLLWSVFVARAGEGALVAEGRDGWQPAEALGQESVDFQARRANCGLDSAQVPTGTSPSQPGTEQAGVWGARRTVRADQAWA